MAEWHCPKCLEAGQATEGEPVDVTGHSWGANPGNSTETLMVNVEVVRYRCPRRAEHPEWEGPPKPSAWLRMARASGGPQRARLVRLLVGDERDEAKAQRWLR